MRLIHKTISVLLISMILWAGYAHADHAVLNSSTWETQDCKLCQNNLETPILPVGLVFDVFNSQTFQEQPIASADISPSKYLLASHRAPPLVR